MPKTLTSRLQGELDTWNAQVSVITSCRLASDRLLCSPYDNNSIDKLLRQADQLMYEQKREAADKALEKLLTTLLNNPCYVDCQPVICHVENCVDS